MSKIYINLCGPYKYVKRAPKSLFLYGSVIPYTESRTRHFVNYKIIFTQYNLTILFSYHVQCCARCSRTYNKKLMKSYLYESHNLSSDLTYLLLLGLLHQTLLLSLFSLQTVFHTSKDLHRSLLPLFLLTHRPFTAALFGGPELWPHSPV